jgi:hypothetical protein
MHEAIWPPKEIQRIDQLDKNAQQRDNEQSKKINELLALQGNEQARIEFINDQRKLIDIYAEKIARQSNNRLDNSLIKDQRNKRLNVDKASQELAAKWELKWDPAIYYLMSIFDAEVKKIQTKGHIIKCQPLECPLVVVEKRAVSVITRRCIFSDKSELRVRQYPAHIKSGHLDGALIIDIRFIGYDRTSDQLFDARFNTKRTEIKSIPNRGLELKFSNDPMDDDEFKQIIAIKIKKIINHCLVYSNVNLY